MDKIGISLIWLLPLVSCLHVVEEFGFPGGFVDWFKAYRPKFADINTSFAYYVKINTVMIILAILAALGAHSYLGIRGWLFFVTIQGFNALFHIRGAIKSKRYAPGMVTGILLYLPLAIFGYSYLLKTGTVDLISAVICFALGPWFEIYTYVSRMHTLKERMKSPATVDAVHPENDASGRFYFLDNLRTFIILLVVIFHASYPYSIYFSQGWSVVDTQKSLFFDVFILGLYAFLMPVIFFISGYFGISSLARKGQSAFWKDKLFRIVIPWAVGVLVVAPAMAYMHYLSKNLHPAYLNYWVHYFSSRDYQLRGQGPLYFLGVLTLYYIVLSLVYRIYKPLGVIKSQPIKSWNKILILFGLATGVIFFCGNLLIDEGLFAKIGIFDIPVTRFIPYLCYFFLGVFAYKQQWFTVSGFNPAVKWWPWVCLVCFQAFTTFTRKGLMPAKIELAGYSIFYYFFCLSATIILLAIFRKRFNYTTKLLGSLSANSYPIYFIHMLVVLPLNIAFIGLRWNAFIKYPLVAIFSVLGSYLVSKYALSWIPFFGGAVKRTPAKEMSSLQ